MNLLDYKQGKLHATSDHTYIFFFFLLGKILQIPCRHWRWALLTWNSKQASTFNPEHTSNQTATWLCKKGVFLKVITSQSFGDQTQHLKYSIHFLEQLSGKLWQLWIQMLKNMIIRFYTNLWNSCSQKKMYQILRNYWVLNNIENTVNSTFHSSC